MIVVHEFAGKDVAVVGLGRTGLSVVRALTAGGARVFAWDDNAETRAKAEGAGITLTDISKRDWQNFAALVLSPGVPYRFPQPHWSVRLANMTGIPVIGDMELFARAVAALPARARPKIIGITGTNGKSTTTALIGHILKSTGRDARVGGNIGTGVLDLPGLSANAIYVLELSSYQLDLVSSLRCDVAVFLNLSPDHIDRHGSLDGYKEAKMRIFMNQQRDDLAVVGFDDVETQSIAIGLPALGDRRVVQVSSDYTLGRSVSAVDGRLHDARTNEAGAVGNLDTCPALIGKHNHQNAAAAYAACRGLGLDAPAILKGLQSFPGLAHRMEAIAAFNGVRFVNDSKATNAQAAEQALRAFKNVYWIAGGVPKADGIGSLAPFHSHVTHAYLIGQAEEPFASALQGKVAVTRCGTLARAVEAAYRDATAASSGNAVVLLSPACASFDQFKDFEERGDTFRKLVHEMMPQGIREAV